MKLLFIAIAFTMILSSCWGCETKECFDSKIQYETMVQKNYMEQETLRHNQQLEIIKATPVQVQVENSTTSIWEWIGEAAAIATMGYWAIKVLDILTEL